MQNWARPNTDELAGLHSKPGVWNVTTFAYGGASTASSGSGGGDVAHAAAFGTRQGTAAKGRGAKGLFFRGHGRGLRRAKTSLPIAASQVPATQSIVEEGDGSVGAGASAAGGGGGGGGPAAGIGGGAAGVDELLPDEGVESAGDSGAETPPATIGTQMPQAFSSMTKMRTRYRERKRLNPRRHLTYHVGNWTETYLGSSTMFGDSKEVVTLRRRTVWLPEADADPEGAAAPGAAAPPSQLPPPGLVIRTAARNHGGGSEDAGAGADDDVLSTVLGFARHASHANSAQIAHSTLTIGPRGMEETRRFLRDGHMVVRRSFSPTNSPGTRFAHDELFRKNIERRVDGDGDDDDDGDDGDRSDGCSAAAGSGAASGTSASAAAGI